MKTLNIRDARRLVEQNEDLTVVETLPAEYFDEFHLPGAKNVPLDEDFEKAMRQAVPDEESPVMVYCMDRNCDASEKAAARLERMGYTDVYDLPGGKIEWKENGLPTE